MPTAAKLVAGLLMGLLAWGVSRMLVPRLPEGTDPGRFAEINAALAFVTGWRVTGPRAGQSPEGAVVAGLTAVAATTAMALLLHSFVRMIRQSMRRAYDGPIEALVDTVVMALESGRLLLSVDVIVLLVGGAVVVGLLTEWAGRAWR